MLILAGCTEKEPPEGDPTPLGDKSPMALVCEIQNEFKKLNKPVFGNFKFHEPWEEYRLAAGTTRFASFYEIFLTEEAYRFLAKYSPLEISTSLSPLIIEEDNGADALAIQYVLSYHGKMRNLDPIFPWFVFSKYPDMPLPKAYLKGQPSDHEAVVRSQLKWNKEQRLRYGGGIPYLKRPLSEDIVPDTLEERIIQILNALVSVKPRWNNPDWFDSPDLDIWIVNFESVLNSTPVYPKVGARFRNFIQSDDPELIGTVLLSQSNMKALGVMLDLHKKYWPIYTKNWPRDGIPRDQASSFELDMDDEIITRVHGYCT
jgi:hypothetical protein